MVVKVNNKHLPHLSASFWEQSPQLQSVRDAGFARLTSPEAVMACTLCRVAASLPPSVTLPNQTSINFIAALVGESGSGKTEAMKAARHLMPDIGTPVDGVNIGSGQGIAQQYIVKDSVENNSQPTITSALFCVGEGEQLIKLGKSTDSITLSTIRSAWSGENIGQQNATAERRRLVPADSYRFAMAVGFQPKFAAELLTGVSAGDPQRFLFVGVTHPEQPDIRPSFPKPFAKLWRSNNDGLTISVDREITREIDRFRVQRQRLEIAADPLDSHRHLVQLKTAALLAGLHSNGSGIEVSIQWWNAAALLVEVSRGVRDRLCELSVSDRHKRNGDRAADRIENETIVEASREQRALESMIGSIVRRCQRDQIPVHRNDLHNATASKHRNLIPFDTALQAAIDRRLIIRATESDCYKARNIGT